MLGTSSWRIGFPQPGRDTNYLWLSGLASGHLQHEAAETGLK
jgi:hypothetical protein